MYAIFRFQHARGQWYWVVNFCRQGVSYRKGFFDLTHKGSKGALKAAIAWRDEQLVTVKPLTVAEFCQLKRDNNTSGVPGVHFLTSPAQPHGIWQAKLKIAGKGKHKSFSVLKHGWQSAYEQAVAARAQMLAQAADTPYLYDKLAKKLAAKTLLKK